MNKEHVQDAINIMKRAGQVNMVYWQSRLIGEGRYKGLWLDTDQSETEADMHKCGNAACFAGWVAVSPEWEAAGGKIYDAAPLMPCGEDELDDAYGHEAIAKWLDIPVTLAREVVHGGNVRMSDGAWSPFYGKAWREVGAADVIAKLEQLLAGELE